MTFADRTVYDVFCQYYILHLSSHGANISLLSILRKRRTGKDEKRTWERYYGLTCCMAISCQGRQSPLPRVQFQTKGKKNVWWENPELHRNGTLLSPFVSPIPSKTPFGNLVELLFAIAASAAVRFRTSGTSRCFIHCFSVVRGKTKPVLVSIFDGYLEPKQSRIQ